MWKNLMHLRLFLVYVLGLTTLAGHRRHKSWGRSLVIEVYLWVSLTRRSLTSNDGNSTIPRFQIVLLEFLQFVQNVKKLKSALLCSLLCIWRSNLVHLWISTSEVKLIVTNSLYYNSLHSGIVIYGSGLQSDAEYAEAFARSRWRSAIWGPQRLKQVRISTKQDQRF
jgi:hypothetical protein